MGKRRHTYDSVKAFLFDKNIELKSDNYLHTSTKLLLSCMVEDCGYIWSTKFDHLRDGHGCAKCAGILPHTYEYVQKTLFERGLGIRDKKYFNIKTRMNVFCLKEKCNFEWTARFNELKRTSTCCPKCNHLLKITYKEVVDFLVGKNIILLTKKSKYANTGSCLHFKCSIAECSYEWHTSFGSIKHKNSGCPECVNKKKRLKSKFKYEWVKTWLANHNIILLDNTYKNTSSIINIKCNILECGHIWKSSFGSIKDGTGCPRCAGNLKYTYAFVKEFLLSKNIELLSNEYKNNATYLSLKCKKDNCGHEWQAIFVSLYRQNSGCGRCNEWKNERFTGSCLKKLLRDADVREQYKICSPDLVIRKHIFVDYYLKFNDKIYIIEYNGKQHYKYVKIFHRSRSKYREQVIRDLWLKTYCHINQIILIVIDGRKYKDEKINIYLQRKLSKEIRNAKIKD